MMKSSKIYFNINKSKQPRNMTNGWKPKNTQNDESYHLLKHKNRAIAFDGVTHFRNVSEKGCLVKN